ncbi:MAG: hypothetical protein ACTSUY_02190, partial [Alphaproteobacteria bacterium]
LRLREGFMIRDGAASSLAVCLNNDRVKGVKAELIHPSGDFEVVSQDAFRKIQTFVPETFPVPGNGWVEIGLESPLGFTGNRPGEQFLPEVEEKQVNCRPNGWTEFASCNPGNRSIRRVVTGVRLFFNGTTLEGVQPWCSNLLLAPPALERPN